MPELEEAEEVKEVQVGKTETGGAKRSTGRRKAAPKKPQEVIRIKLVRSLIGSSPHQRAVVAGLGLRRLNQVVERKNTREIQGMVAKVPHLVQVTA